MRCVEPSSARFFLLLVIVSSFFLFPSVVKAQSDYPFSMNGPYIEKIDFEVMEEPQQQLLGLLNDQIDITYDNVPEDLMQVAIAAKDIEVSHTLRNGYGVLIINCNKYPYNITAFRRALAFALDKEAICDDIWHGLAFPQDSVVPSINPWSIEGQLPYTYYDPNVEMGNSLLDHAGFKDVDGDGFREAPDGSSFQVKIEGAWSSPRAAQVDEKARDALNALSIDAVALSTDFYGYLDRIEHHGDYDIVFLGINFMDYDVDWMGYEFHSASAEVPFSNNANFRNDTADYWAEKLIHARTFDEAREASAELQKLLIYECPWIICYHNFFVNAYRTDRFEGFIDIQSNNWWTYFNVKLKVALGGPFGGTIRCGIRYFGTLNLLVANTVAENEVLGELYDSLLKMNPNLNYMNWLCEGYILQTHADNPSVPDGHTRMTFDIVRNATWTDGTPLTGEDVSFSLNYLRDILGYLGSGRLQDMFAAFAPTPYQVVFEFDSESIWNLHSVAYMPIMPKHVFEEIGLSGWNTWNPHPPNDEMVTSGPFNVTEYLSGEFAELTRNDNYFRGLEYTSKTGDTGPQQEGNVALAFIAGTISAAATITFGGLIVLKKTADDSFLSTETMA